MERSALLEDALCPVLPLSPAHCLRRPEFKCSSSILHHLWEAGRCVMRLFATAQPTCSHTSPAGFVVKNKKQKKPQMIHTQFKHHLCTMLTGFFFLLLDQQSESWKSPWEPCIKEIFYLYFADSCWVSSKKKRVYINVNQLETQ